VAEDKTLIIYDGDCIFCKNYARLVRLRETVGDVEMIDARSSDPRIAEYWRRGYDLNEGMLFVYKGRVHYGSEAVHVIASLSNPSSWFSRLNIVIFSRKLAADLLYPILKIGRRVTLILRGRQLISRPEVRPNDSMISRHREERQHSNHHRD
jgi:predicted DCC family thiol-disulfide oxidoreductase YuxK